MKYACPKCCLALVVRKNGVGVEVMADFGSYQFWRADLLECPGCGNQVICFADRPVIEHFEQGYAQWVVGHRMRRLVFQVWHTLREKERAQPIQ